MNFGLLIGQNTPREGVTLGNHDGISHNFLNFYKPNKQSINQDNNQQINP